MRAFGGMTSALPGAFADRHAIGTSLSTKVRGVDAYSFTLLIDGAIGPNRGMDKDPKRRLPDIGDARLALEGAFGGAVPR